MTNLRLGSSYVERARGRLPFLRQMRAAGLHADVVRESGDDFVPSDEYDADDSTEAIQFAETIVGWVVAGMKEIGAGG